MSTMCQSQRFYLGEYVVGLTVENDALRLRWHALDKANIYVGHSISDLVASVHILITTHKCVHVPTNFKTTWGSHLFTTHKCVPPTSNRDLRIKTVTVNDIGHRLKSM